MVEARRWRCLGGRPKMASVGRRYPLQLLVHGARGSAPVSGPQFAHYGGYTSCFEVVSPDAHRLIIDCGSGLRCLEAGLEKRGEQAAPFEATVLLTHFHWDHIQGLPFFGPLYRPTTRLHFVASPPQGFDVAAALASVLRPPWFPVDFLESGAQLSFQTLSDGPLSIGSLEITSSGLNHPGGVTGYRVAHDGGVLVTATDVEAASEESRFAVARFAEGATVLLHDAQYTPAEYEASRRGWGHSTWQHATRVAADAGVGRLVVTSHDPTRTDEQVAEIVGLARAEFRATEAAFEGQRIDF